MLDAAVILFIVLLSAAQNLFCKTYTMSYPGSPDDAAAVYASVTGGVTAAAAFALYGFSFDFSPLTLLLGVINAGFGLLLDIALIRISRTGPYSIQMVFVINGGILIPAAVSCCFGDAMTPARAAALTVLILAVYLISKKDKEAFTDKKAFFLFCAAAAVGNGCFLSLLDVQQRLTGAGEKNAMVAVSYFFLAVFSLCWLAIRRGRDLFGAFRISGKPLYRLLISALIIAAAINAKVFMLPLISTALLYTFDNAGALLLSVCFSRILFREKLSAVNITGCVLITAALICVALF